MQLLTPETLRSLPAVILPKLISLFSSTTPPLLTEIRQHATQGEWQAMAQAAADKSGIRRYGHSYVPMDEALVLVVIDFSGRPFLAFDAELGQGRIGEFDVELTEEFLK